MRLLISLVLLLFVVGYAFADVPGYRRAPRPPVNGEPLDALKPGLPNWARVMLRFVAPSVWPVYRPPSFQKPLDVPVFPFCTPELCVPVPGPNYGLLRQALAE